MASTPTNHGGQAAKLVTATNDFLRTQGEVEAPYRRGGLDAAAILQHLTEDQFRDLQRQWGTRALKAHEFVAMLRGAVIEAGYFHPDGSRNLEAWAAEGWRCKALDASRPRHTIKGAVALPTSPRRLLDDIPTMENDSHTPHLRPDTADAEGASSVPPLDEATGYLYDVFDFIDSRRAKSLTWEGFTMFLVEGISSLNKAGAGGLGASVDLTYVFRGELPMLGLEPTDTSKEWFSALRYIPSLDSLMCVSRRKIALQRLDKRSEIVFEHPSNVLIAAAEYLPSKNLLLSSTFQGHLHGWCVNKGKAVELFKMPVPAAPQGSVATCLMTQGSKLWCGTSTGHIASSIVTERGLNKYQFADPKSFRPHTDAVTCMTQLPHNTTVVSASLDHNIYVFDAVGGVGREKEVAGRGHSYGILSMDFNAHSTVLLTGGFEAKICAWAENLWRTPVFALRDTQRPLETVIGIKSIPSTPYVAVGDSRGALKIFDLRKRTVVYTMEVCDPDNFDAGLLRRDHIRRRDAVANSDAGGRSEGEPTVASLGAAGAAFFSSFEYTGVQHRHLVFGGSRSFFFGMGADTQESPTQTCDSDTVMRLATGVRSAFVTVVDGGYTLWSASTGLPEVRRQVILPEPTHVTFAMLHPNGDLLVLGHTGGRVSTHHLPSGISLRMLRASHDTPVQTVLLHPTGGAALVTASTDAKLCFWTVDIEEAEPPVSSDGEGAHRVLPYQMVQGADTGGLLVDLAYVGDSALTLAVLCPARVSFWTFVEEFRRWVHSYDLPVAMSPKQSIVSTPASRRSTIASQSAAATPSAAEVRRAKARDKMLRKQSKVMPTQFDTIVAGAFAPKPRMPTTRQRPGVSERLLGVVTDSGQLILWAVDSQTGAAAPYARASAPSVARKLLPSAAEGVSPKLHCIGFCESRPHLIATGDDLGRITVWMLPMEALHPRGASSVRTHDGHRIEELATNTVHTDSVLSVRFTRHPLDCIVSMGADHCVCVCSWNGTPVSKLQQGPLVARTWMLPDTSRLKYSWLRLQAVLRWQRVRVLVHSKTLHSAVADGPPPIPAPFGERPLWSDEEEADEASRRSFDSNHNSRKPSTMPIIAVEATPSTPSLTLPSLRGRGASGAAAMARKSMFAVDPLHHSEGSLTSSPRLRIGSDAGVPSPRALSISGGATPGASSSVMFLGENTTEYDDDDDDMGSLDFSSGGQARPRRAEHLTALPRCLIAPYVPPRDTIPSVIASRVPARAPPPPPTLPRVPINRDIIALLHPKTQSGADLLSPLPLLKLTDPAQDVPQPRTTGGVLRRNTRKPKAFETRPHLPPLSMTPDAKRADMEVRKPPSLYDRSALTPPPPESHPYGLVVTKKKSNAAATSVQPSPRQART